MRSATTRSLCYAAVLKRRVSCGVRLLPSPARLVGARISIPQLHVPFSSVAVAEDPSFDEDAFIESIHKHCTTCTCDEDSTTAATRKKGPDQQQPNQQKPEKASSSVPACEIHPLPHSELPPPLPEPKYSVRRRVMPASLLPLNSMAGRRFLMEALAQHTAAAYFTLMEHFSNQSDPAFCGVTTLMIVLNSLAVDPQVRWKGGWRYFGNEDVLLSQCCIESERVRRIGISMEEFAQLGTCQGLRITMKRPKLLTKNNQDEDEQEEERRIDEFRTDLLTMLREGPQPNVRSESDTVHPSGLVVVSFSREALGQTGDGHFSPIAAYHSDTDQVLMLDVARFKYQPYWVSVADLYLSMCPLDSATGKPRGWYLLYPPEINASYKGQSIYNEDLRPAELVPLVGQKPLCPIHPIKIDFCKVAHRQPHPSDQKKSESKR